MFFVGFIGLSLIFVFSVLNEIVLFESMVFIFIVEVYKVVDGKGKNYFVDGYGKNWLLNGFVFFLGLFFILGYEMGVFRKLWIVKVFLLFEIVMRMEMLLSSKDINVLGLLVLFCLFLEGIIGVKFKMSKMSKMSKLSMMSEFLKFFWGGVGLVV